MGVPIPQPASASVDSASGAQVIKGSLLFNGSNQYLSRNFGTGGDRRRWTWSAWVKRHTFGASNYGLFSYDPGGNGSFIRFSDDGGGDTLRWFSDYNSRSLVTEGQFRDPSSWYHIVIAVDTSNGSDTPGGAASLNERDRVKRYINGVLQVNNASATFPDKNENQDLNQSGNHSLGRIQASNYGPVSMSNVYFISGRQLEPEEFGFTDPLTGIWRPKKFNIRDENNPNDGSTWSNGVTLGAGSFLEPASKAFDGNLLTSAAPYDTSGGGGANPSITCSFTSFGGIPFKRSVRVFRSNGQANNHTISFNGGTPVNHPWFQWFTVATGPGTLNSLQSVNNNSSNTTGIAAIEVDGYVLIDGTVNNSFYLPMENQDDFEKDKSGNGNDWTKNNFSGTETDPDVLKDSPSGAAFSGAPTSGITTTSSAPSNYCTWNPFNRTSTAITVSEGNLKAQLGSTGHVMITGTMSMPKGSGKYYWEIVTAGWNTGNQGPVIGVVGDTHKIADQAGGSPSILYRAEGVIYVDGSSAVSGQTTFTTNDVIGVALNLDDNTITWYKNGSQLYQYTSVSSSVNSWLPAWKDSDSGGNAVANWGQKPFKYAPPEGFKSVSSSGTKPETVISDPSIYVGVTTYQGVAGGRQQDETLSFTPDLVWVKNRSTGEDSKIYDTVRGKSGDNFENIESNTTASSQGESGAIQEMLPGGFYATGGGHVNSAGVPFVAYMWRAGGGNTLGSSGNEFWVDGKNYASAAAAGLDDGSITPSAASVGTKQGFSIIKWLGVNNATPQTISHGLTNQTPRFILIKNMDQTYNWFCYHAGVDDTAPEDYYLRLNTNDSRADSDAAWNDTAPTTTVVSLNNDGSVQRLNDDFIMYCWADVPGLQKFGRYKTNGDGSGGGSEDGPYVELGFRPAMILFKGSSYGSDWTWIDDRRCRVNYNDVAYRANYQYGDLGNTRGGVGSSSQPENYAVDFLSNGFKIRASAGSLNYQTTNTVTYAAWAKSPFSDLYGGGANAR
ncbi:hypothetical protein CMO86_01180 [Candidatus Woesearchaeota archaeon]|nr:hypothetical protein [Candidatus Woesearchaeota archaeon]